MGLACRTENQVGPGLGLDIPESWINPQPTFTCLFAWDLSSAVMFGSLTVAGWKSFLSEFALCALSGR